MTVNEVFEHIIDRQVEALMLHDQMSLLFDFMNMHGFKRMHEYRFFSESAEMRGVQRYFVNHYNMLPHNEGVKSIEVIPDSWYKYTRQDVDSSTKRNAVQMGFEKWVKWEKETKKLYESYYTELCNMGEIAAAMKVKDLVKDVDKEVKYADRLHIKLNNLNYDLSFMYLMQDELHEKYENLEKDIRVEMC